MEKQPRAYSTSESERQDENVEKDAGDTSLPSAEPHQSGDTAETPVPASEPAPVLVSPESDIPDGGWQAWFQVCAAWVVLLQTWGLVNTFGVFQNYYEQNLPNTNASSISWIGSLQGALMMLVGVVSGPLYDAGYFRHMLLVGIVLMNLGMFMTSLCTQYWQAVLAQGITIGLGMGLTFLPSAAILSQYFHRHRALALGLASTGSPIAGITFPILFSALEPRVGFGWATRAIAFVLLALSAIPIAFLRERPLPTAAGPRKIRSLFDRSALSDTPFILTVTSFAFSFLTLYVAFFYIQLAVESFGIATPEFSPYLVTFLNVGSIPGRVLPNALADRYGGINMLIVCTLASAVLMFGCYGITNLGGATAFAVLYGISSGGLVSLTPSVIMTLSPDRRRMGARLGMNFLLAGSMLLVGTPIAGAVLGKGRWGATIGYAAGGLTIATIAAGLARMVHWRKHGTRWI